MKPYEIEIENEENNVNELLDKHWHKDGTPKNHNISIDKMPDIELVKNEEKIKVRRSTLKEEYKAIKHAATLHRLYFINDNGRIDKTLLIRWIDENFQLFVNGVLKVRQLGGVKVHQ
jgi:hypothetical protein